VTVLHPWKGVERREDAMRRVREFLLANTPARPSND
jgi:hypothetical protein